MKKKLLHGLLTSTAARRATIFIVRAGSPETAELTWSKVQRRIAQLIREDNFYTEAERDSFDDIDPIAIGKSSPSAALWAAKWLTRKS